MVSQNQTELRENSCDIFFDTFERMLWTEDVDVLDVENRMRIFQHIFLGPDVSGKRVRVRFSHEQFNSILTEYNQPTVGKPFFDFFFEKFSKESGALLGDFMESVDLFIKVAMWKFGNFGRVLRKLGKSNEIGMSLKGIEIENLDPVDMDEFRMREPFVLEDLTAAQRSLLGYVVEEGDASEDETTEARKKGKSNVEVCFRHIGSLDVYVATSMQKKEEYEPFVRFMKDVFNHPDIKKMKLRYFDPTLTFCDDPIDKGLLEALMLKRAKLTLYFAGKADSFGKVSECAATLCQGKPVIVYVESVDPNIDKDAYEVLERRAKIFTETHPLRLQVALHTGVANGVIVVRSPEECRGMLREVLLHKLETRIDRLAEKMTDKVLNGVMLREKTTGSILRIVTENKRLTRVFWNYYLSEW